MGKDAYYFSHDYNARNDEKILELRAQFGAEGYGIFWMLVETMAENDNCGVKATLLGGLSLGYGVAKARLCEIIEACLRLNLFHEKDGYYFSNRLLSHKELRNKLKENGVKGAKIRWGGYSYPNGDPNGGAYAKERKGKESKGNVHTEENQKEKEKGIFKELTPRHPIPKDYAHYFLPKYGVVVFEDETCQPLDERAIKLLTTGQMNSWHFKKDFSVARPLSEVEAEYQNRTRST